MSYKDAKETWTFYFFDKIIIAAIAAAFVIIFQSMAHKYQEILDARFSVCKMYTDIMLKYRENLIDTMNKYFLMLEQIKSNRFLNKKESVQIKEYYFKIIFCKNSLCTIKPTGSVCMFEKEAQSFISDVSALNDRLFEGDFSENEVSNNIHNINNKYLIFLEKHRDITLKIVENEMLKFGKLNLIKLWIGSWFGQNHN